MGRGRSTNLKRGKLMKKILAAALVATMWTSVASATTVLYRNDSNIGTDYMAAALASPAYTVTAVTGSISSYALSSFDIVVYANQNNSEPDGDLALLNTFIGGGGKAIYANWTGNSANLGGVVSGGTNQTLLTVGSLFSAGLTNPLSVVNPGWGTFSRGLTATSGTVAGTFGNGDSAIIVGNNGRTIYNGFLTDTVASQRLYSNELASLAGAVPEPGTWAMMLAGFGMIGFAVRKRSSVKTTVSYA